MNTIYKSMRKGHGLTLSQLGAQVGLSISFLSDLERGRTEASMETLRKLATYYGVVPSLFIDAPGTRTQTPVPLFQVCHFILFTCLQCGFALEIKRYGEHHRSSSEHCPTCKARYVVDWETPIEQSALMLIAAKREVEA